MAWYGELGPDIHSQRLKPVKVAETAVPEKGARKVAFRLPSVGMLLRVGGGIASDEQWINFAKTSLPYDPRYRGWNLVRKSPEGWFGFGGYFVGLGWSNDQIRAYMQETGQGILDSMVRLHQYDHRFVHNCLAALIGEKPFTRDYARELQGVFGATLGRMRALVYSEENIVPRNGVYGPQLVQDALRQHDQFHQSVETIAHALPDSECIYDPKNPEEFLFSTHFPLHHDSSESSGLLSTEELLVVGQIGMVGLPPIRAVLAQDKR